MKKVNVILIITIVLSLAHIIDMKAQAKPWDRIYTVDGGISLLQGSENGSNLTGYLFSFTFDQVAMNPALAGGFSIGYMRATEETGDSGTVYSSIPFTLQGKYLFGSGSVQGYLQGGIGIHFSQIEYFGRKFTIAGSDGGIILSAGLGSHIGLNEKMYLNAVYNFNWIDSKTYQNGIVHTIKIGLAF